VIGGFVAAALAVVAVRLALLSERASRAERLEVRLGEAAGGRRSGPARGLRRKFAAATAGLRANTRAGQVLAALGGGLLGAALAGPPVGIAGAVAGAAIPRLAARRRGDRVSAELDVRVGEFADAVASAVRGGLSIAQAVAFAAEEARSPLDSASETMLRDRRTGVPLTEALDRFASTVRTDEARLLSLVLGMHHRSGGDVATALEEIRSTIRSRLDLRRELRAITAQGRISGFILGVLPVVFFLVLDVTSRSELAPVLRSPAGVALVGLGLALDGLAYLWIRRLLRVEV